MKIKIRLFIERIKPRRSWWPWYLLLSIILTMAFVSASSQTSELQYDRTSAKKSGTKALALLLKHYGANVSSGNTPQGNTAILFFDDLSELEREELTSWVSLGGNLVVADPDSRMSDLALGGKDVLVQKHSLSASCDVPEVNGAEKIEPSATDSYSVFQSQPLATACFPARKGAFMVREKLGDGEITFLGSGNIFTNEQLDKADNSVLAVNLLDPQAGDSITFLRSEGLISTGDDGLSDLIPNSVNAFILQLIIAGAALALWRARRLGKPVIEAQPVEVAASQLTVAKGNLLQHASLENGSAEILRADLRRNLASLIGITHEVKPEFLAQVVSDRTRISYERLLDATVDRPVSSQRELVELARTIEDVHREVANAR